MEPIRREVFLLEAIGCMVGPDMREVTPEEVGVLKLLKLAVEMDKFSQQLKAEGRDTYTLGELSDKVIMPVLKL
ncbi:MULTISPECIES: addiction module toxin RelE [unclassified Neglectibacter]|uniref:addiction module toxin RelE n=1 Tax=unclassified Neglectibacter TaxID=2632164 RepID=UPI00191C4FF4|nr:MULTISPECIES: addiction module toxin RelE [unclassified Neglectibacter]